MASNTKPSTGRAIRRNRQVYSNNETSFFKNNIHRKSNDLEDLDKRWSKYRTNVAEYTLYSNIQGYLANSTVYQCKCQNSFIELK